MPTSVWDSPYQQLASLQREMRRSATAWAGRRRFHPQHELSARNLLHYLALRRHDLSALQRQLSQLGLTSLGRSEASILKSVETLLATLATLRGAAFKPGAKSEGPDFEQGRELLGKHTAALLGPPPSDRWVRMMVTLPGEAARDPGLVRALVKEGMDCARINSAHDDPAAWEQMAANVRRASQELKKNCRILVDLAGPKLRTGPLPPGPAVLKCRPQRNEFGQVLNPAQIWLVAAGGPVAEPPVAGAFTVPVSRTFLASLGEGNEVNFTDARGAHRVLRIGARHLDGCAATLEKTAYFVPRLRLWHGKQTGRVGNIPAREGFLQLYPGQRFRLVRPGAADGRAGDLPALPCLVPEVFRHVRAGERVFIDDGRIAAIVEKAGPAGLELRVTHARTGGEKIRAGKGLNFPDSQLQLPVLNKADQAVLRWAARHADLVGLSFAQSAAGVAELKRRLAALGRPDMGLVLKIETKSGFRFLPEMLLELLGWRCGGVMIARGDLAVEYGYEYLAEVQEEILCICEAAHTPVIWATQVLEMLAKTGRPSRAEITDAAIGERAECVMLNKGPYILDAIRMLDRILRLSQTHQRKKTPKFRALTDFNWPRPA